MYLNWLSEAKRSEEAESDEEKAHQKPTNCRRIFRRAATEININNSNKKSFGLRVKHLRLEKVNFAPAHEVH